MNTVTKSESDGEHPCSNYLVCEDDQKPSTWHLRVKDKNGNPDHTLMGAAWAALHSGYRGNKYEGPNKDEAIKKLTTLYKSEKMDTPSEASFESRLGALEANQPRKEDGKYHGAAAATAEAYDASAEVDAYDGHMKAADLHEVAAGLHKEDGNDAMAEKHKLKAAWHRGQADALKGTMQPMAQSTNPAEMAGTQHATRNTQRIPIEGSFVTESPATFEKFMVMAGGIQTVTLGKLGSPLTITINVNPDSAKALQAQLDIVNRGGNQKAFNCFDHEKKEASSWPKRFFWSYDPAPGIYESAEPTKSGLEAIEGKMYRGFSMTFFTDEESTARPAFQGGGWDFAKGAKGTPENPANIICPIEAGDDPSPYLNMGTMTNRPAFTNNQPLFAAQPNLPGASAPGSAAGAQSSQTTTGVITNNMNPTEEKAALQARNQQLEQRVTELQAKSDAVSQAQLQAARAELETNQAKIELAAQKEKTASLEAAQQHQKEKDADAAVELMVNNGAIPSLDKELKASYRGKFIADPSLIPLCTAMRGAIPAGRAVSGSTAALTAGNPRFAYGDVKEGALQVLRSMAQLCTRQMSIPGLDATANEKRGIVARDMAVIYRNEIRGKSFELDADGHKIPTINPDFVLAPIELAAANDAGSLGTLAGTLVTQRYLDIFMYKLPLITNGKIMTDFSDQPSELNQTVTTRKVLIPAPVTYDPTLQADGFPNGWIPTGAPQTADISITMNALVGTPIQFDLAVLSSTQRQLFSEQAPAAAYANALYLMRTIYNVCTAANYNAYANITAPDANGVVKVPIAYTTYPVALIDFARSKLAEIAAAFDANEVPDEDRSVLLNAGYYNKATTDPSLVTFFAGQQAPEIVTQGKLPDLAGFVPIKAPNFPAANNTVGIALQKNGLLVKTRLPTNLNTIQPGAGNGTVTQIVHPDTGISMMVVLWTDHRRGYSAWLPCFLLGASAGDVRGGLVITSQ